MISSLHHLALAALVSCIGLAGAWRQRDGMGIWTAVAVIYLGLAYGAVVMTRMRGDGGGALVLSCVLVGVGLVGAGLVVSLECARGEEETSSDGTGRGP